MDIIDQLKKDLEAWKEQCEEEEQRKSNAQLAKLEADDRKKKAQKRVDELEKKMSITEEHLSKIKDHYSMEMLNLQREKEELNRNINELNIKLKNCTRECEKARNELQVDNNIPQKNINYSMEESGSGNLSDISYTCQFLIQAPYVLQGGQALLTFEDEEVAGGIIDKGRHNVEFNDKKEILRAHDIETGRTVKFEVNMTISSKKIKIVNLPTDLPEDTLKDKLELTFYKSNIGGGEIESVEYNRNNNSACITYKDNGVAQRVLKTNQLLFTVGTLMYEVGITPVIEDQLNKLQIFSGVCHRSVLLTDIRNQTESEDDIKDLIEIHFQKQSNGGGEVECLAFSHQKKMVHFEEDAD